MFLDFSPFCPFWGTGCLSLLQADAGDSGPQSCVLLYMDHFSQWWLLRNLQILNKEKEEGLWEREEVRTWRKKKFSPSPQISQHTKGAEDRPVDEESRGVCCFLEVSRKGAMLPRGKTAHVQGRLLRHKSPHCSPQLRRSLEGAEYTRPKELHG